MSTSKDTPVIFSHMWLEGKPESRLLGYWIVYALWARGRIQRRELATLQRWAECWPKRRSHA